MSRQPSPWHPPRGERIASRYVNTGYYPGYDVLDNQQNWDEVTWKAVRERMEQTPPIRFFTPHEHRLYERLCNLIAGQDPERDAWTVLIVNFLDRKLDRNETDGYRFAGMPPMQEAFRLGARAVDESAMAIGGASFTQLAAAGQRQVISLLARHEPPGELWRELDPKHFWHMLTTAALHIFYSHPYAWNEIGFGGPVYPLGYLRLTEGLPDPWERREDRAASRYRRGERAA